MKNLFVFLSLLALACVGFADCFNSSSAVDVDQIGTQYTDVFGCSMVEAKGADSMTGLVDLGLFGILVVFGGVPILLILVAFGAYIVGVIFSK
jgi:hypothetical protein